MRRSRRTSWRCAWRRASASRTSTRYNYDGEPLKTEGSGPMLLPHQNARPSQDDANAALGRYYLTPLTVDEQVGQLVILRDLLISTDYWTLRRALPGLVAHFSKSQTPTSGAGALA